METKEINLWEVMPAIALRGLTIFPNMIIHFDVSRQKSIIAVEQAMMQDQKLFLVTQKDMSVEEPLQDEVYTIGTIAVVKQVSKLPGGLVRVLVEGLSRGRLEVLENVSAEKEEDQFLQASVEPVIEEVQDEEEELSVEEEAMLRQIREMLGKYSMLNPKIAKSLTPHIEKSNSLAELLDQLAINMPLTYDKKQRVLESVEVGIRYDEMIKILAKEIEVGKLKNKLSEVVKGKVEENQKEFLLREQLKYIRKELGEDQEGTDAEQFEDLFPGLQTCIPNHSFHISRG